MKMTPQQKALLAKTLLEYVIWFAETYPEEFWGDELPKDKKQKRKQKPKKLHKQQPH